ncbi:transmembrane and coiled-coil domain-containing protein 3-like isoform X2 [Anneissia japonica]|uniref:transmembrane and coiled-coil domain-containing protein 3-like isoform X2 n=1 Tax=Anneissia japonica TaxID=1529436 RepID=UPI001425B98E|nr:transmembrane and coiled-coil domain-containing protein 3-like isoform X2 [Anneissia japonica]
MDLLNLIGQIIVVFAVVESVKVKPIPKNLANHELKLHRGRLLVDKHKDAAEQKGYTTWLKDSCVNLIGLLSTKEKVIKKLNAAIADVRMKQGIEEPEREFQVHTFEIFQKELNESENSIFMAINSLRRDLQGDYKDLINMKDSSLLRLEALREATLREEQEFNDLLAAEKHQIEYQEHLKHLGNASSPSNRSKVDFILDEILEEVAIAADKLEHRIEEHAFDQSKQVRGAFIEAVVRLDENGKNVNRSKAQANHQDVMSLLVDTSNNQYVLTKPKDTTVPHEDHHFIQDILMLVILAFACGWLCNSLHLPAMFGYIMAGVILGSSGFGAIKAVVQVETLSEFGAFFILFCVGLEFSPEKIRKVLHVAVCGSLSMTTLMICFGLVFGYFLHIVPRHSVFIAACLSLSSTPLVVKFLGSAHKHGKAEDIEDPDYSSTLLGILVVQDVQLGLLVAILPALAGAEKPLEAGGHSPSFALNLFRTLLLVFELFASLWTVLMLSFFISRYLVSPIFYRLRGEASKELLLLGVVSLAFVMLMITNLFGISMELGCFLAGAILSTQGHSLVDEIQHLVEPLKDFFAALFFASIGLHVFPTFVLYELSILLSLTFMVVIIKCLTGVLVLGILLPSTSSNIKWIVASGLAQVSEFSFVLGSRARRLGILSREVYLLILSITTLSLLLAPFLWRLSTYRFRRSLHRSIIVR